MRTMSEANMREMNGGGTYIYYKCGSCGYCLATKSAMWVHHKLHKHTGCITRSVKY